MRNFVEIPPKCAVGSQICFRRLTTDCIKRIWKVPYLFRALDWKHISIVASPIFHRFRNFTSISQNRISQHDMALLLKIRDGFLMLRNKMSVLNRIHGITGHHGRISTKFRIASIISHSKSRYLWVIIWWFGKSHPLVLLLVYFGPEFQIFGMGRPHGKTFRQHFSKFLRV